MATRTGGHSWWFLSYMKRFLAAFIVSLLLILATVVLTHYFGDVMTFHHAAMRQQ
jgi:hypothetical protein